MKYFTLTYILLLASFAFAYFSPAQLEILDLHYKIQPKNFKPTDDIRTFYSLLSIKPSASDDELESAYRKMSRKLHPDKFVKADPKDRRRAERKFETLSLVISILRDVERRKNYDYFVKNGFPVWDNSKARYIFKNRSKPTFVITLSVILLLSTIGQVIILKLNKKQKNKRVEQILRDVRWKADNMSKSTMKSNKVMELPDDYELDTNFSGYSVDDKLVTYCGKVFIVKPDRSVLLYNDENLNVEDETAMNDLVKKIMESGHFSLYGLQKKEMNRKERREVEKKNKKESNSEVDDVVEKLVQFKEDESALKLTDLYPVKIVLGIWRLIFGKVNKESSNETLKHTESNDTVETEVEEEVEEKPVSSKVKVSNLKTSSDGKVTLPNGKTLRSRKK